MSRKLGQSQKLGRAELATAYELRYGGVKCRWIDIAKALGVTVHYLRIRIKQVEADGIAWLI
jgi:hypothetical protein